MEALKRRRPAENVSKQRRCPQDIVYIFFSLPLILPRTSHFFIKCLKLGTESLAVSSNYKKREVVGRAVVLFMLSNSLVTEVSLSPS